jgi:hypothetical protein
MGWRIDMQGDAYCGALPFEPPMGQSELALMNTPLMDGWCVNMTYFFHWVLVPK